MSDNWNDDDDNSQETGGALRKQLTEALAAKKAAETERDNLKREVSIGKVQSSLKDKGFKESAASWAAKDGVDLDDENALKTWLEGPGQDFKLPASESDSSSPNGDGPGEPSTQAVQPPHVSPHMSTHGNVMDQLRAQASPASVNKYQAVMESLRADASPQEVDAAFRAAGL